MRSSRRASTRSRVLRCIEVCICVLVVAGCQENTATVSGLVMLDGQPLAIKEGMRGTVVFQPASGEGATLSGVIDSDGRYQLAAGSATAVPSGRYWITVSAVQIVPPSEDNPEPTGRRVTPAKYASATDSGLQAELVSGLNEVNLALTSEADPPPETAEVDDAPAEDASQPEEVAEGPEMEP